MSATVVTCRPEVLFGVERVEHAGEGDAMTGSMVLDERHAGPDGRTAAGGLGVLVDEVLGYSLIASLPPRSWTISTEIWMDLVAPLPASGRLVADARTVQTGSLAVGRVLDEDGRLLVECRERGRQIEETPDYESCAGAPDAVRDAGLDALLGMSLGELSCLEVTPDLENPRAMLHGGVSLAAAEVVATWSRSAAGSPLATSSLHVVHTRAAPAGSLVELRATTVHAGRSLWVTDVTGTVEGRTVVLARVSAE